MQEYVCSQRRVGEKEADIFRPAHHKKYNELSIHTHRHTHRHRADTSGKQNYRLQ